jgi:hypothetical protein
MSHILFSNPPHIYLMYVWTHRCICIHIQLVAYMWAKLSSLLSSTSAFAWLSIQPDRKIHDTSHIQKYMDTHISSNIVLGPNALLLYLLLGTAAFRTIPFGVVRWRIHQHHAPVVWAPRGEVAAWLLEHRRPWQGGATVQHRETRSNFWLLRHESTGLSFKFRPCLDAFKILNFLLFVLSHRIFEHMHGALNIDKNN